MLNETQQNVVSHENGPALVIAGAGTGKTRVLAHRAAELLRGGVPPQRLLLIAFTRKAAQELNARVDQMLEEDLVLSWCNTFHATAARLLRLYGRDIGLNPRFSILDQTDAAALFNNLLHEHYSKEEQRTLPGKATLYKLQSYQANTQCELHEAVEEVCPKQDIDFDRLQHLLQSYGDRKNEIDALDYDDLLLTWLQLLRLPHERSRSLFDFIMVDEYQDTNILQAEILYELGKSTPNIMVVGDDAQAIFGFRGATVENMLHFESAFPGALRLKLEQNYRSTQNILDTANTVLAQAEEGYPKHLFTYKTGGEQPRLQICSTDWLQAETVLGNIAHRHRMENVPLSEQAVIFRSSHHAYALEVLLQRQKIPYRKYGGLRLVETAHIKDVLAFLRCAENVADESAWHRVLELIPGVGPKTASRIYERIQQGRDVPETLQEMRLPSKAEEWRQPLVECMRTLYDTRTTFDKQMQTIAEFCKDIMPNVYDDADRRTTAVAELQTIAERYTSPRSFLDDIQVGDDSSLHAPDQDDTEQLTLTTIHSAKGCEWPHVHVLGLVEGNLPALQSQHNPAKREEERRMLYVALTRAQNTLSLYSYTYQTSGGRGPGKQCERSSFLTQEVVDHCVREGRSEPGYSMEAPALQTNPAEDSQIQYDYSDPDLIS